MEQEPPDFDDPLLSLDNVLVTPNAVFYSETAMAEVRIKSAQEVVKVFKGELAGDIVSAKLLESAKLRMIVASVRRW